MENMPQIEEDYKDAAHSSALTLQWLLMAESQGLDWAALRLPLDRHDETDLGLEEAKSGKANPNQEPSLCRGTC